MLVFKGSYTFISFPVKRDFANKPLSRFPRTHYSIIPLFQHSLAQTGFSHGTGYYSDVAPLAQTGMLKDCGPSFPVAPGRAGRANCERSELSSF
jgi:hypothetical protein